MEMRRLFGQVQRWGRKAMNETRSRISDKAENSAYKGLVYGAHGESLDTVMAGAVGSSLSNLP